jgi:hypothetical protein
MFDGCVMGSVTITELVLDAGVEGVEFGEVLDFMHGVLLYKRKEEMVAK